MKKRIAITFWGIIVLLAVSVLVYFVAIPKYRFSRDYDDVHGMTAEQTVEKYFEYISARNPKQANMLKITPSLAAYSCNMVISAKADDIKDNGKPQGYSYNEKYKDCYDCKELLVNYECHCLFGFDGPLFSGDNSIFICLVKRTEDSDWKIAEMYTGI